VVGGIFGGLGLHRHEWPLPRIEEAQVLDGDGIIGTSATQVSLPWRDERFLTARPLHGRGAEMFSDQLVGCANFSTASVIRSVIGAMVCSASLID
jgi:hypothetical protein